MQLQGRNLFLRTDGEDVALLQRELQQLGFTIAESEVTRRFFGESTRAAVILFQQQQGLQPTGVVDERTAPWTPPPRPSFLVNGVIRWSDGTVAPHLAVRAVDKDLRSEELLGEATTSENGFYEIAYTAGEFARSEKRTADLIVRVFDPEGGHRRLPTLCLMRLHGSRSTSLSLQWSARRSRNTKHSWPNSSGFAGRATR